MCEWSRKTAHTFVIDKHNTEIKMSEPKNHAQIKTFGMYAAIHDIKCVDGENCIFKGKRVIEPGQPDDSSADIYFINREMPEVNDFDKMYPIIHFKGEELLGFEFWLVPKDKLIFGYIAPPKEGIIIPRLSVSKKRGPGGITI